MAWELIDQGGPLGCDYTYRLALDPATTAGGYLYICLNGNNNTIPPAVVWVPGPTMSIINAGTVANTGTVTNTGTS